MGNKNYLNALISLNMILKDCFLAVKFVNIKVECLLKSDQYEEADRYTKDIQENGHEQIKNDP